MKTIFLISILAAAAWCRASPDDLDRETLSLASVVDKAVTNADSTGAKYTVQILGTKMKKVTLSSQMLGAYWLAARHSKRGGEQAKVEHYRNEAIHELAEFITALDKLDAYASTIALAFGKGAYDEAVSRVRAEAKTFSKELESNQFPVEQRNSPSEPASPSRGGSA